MPDKCEQDIESQVSKIDAAISGDQSEEHMEALQDALNYSWPMMQKYLIEQGAKDDGYEGDPYEPYETTDEHGNQVTHYSADAWWLKDFNEEDVIMQLPRVCIFLTQPFHLSSVCMSLRDAYGVERDQECDDCFTEEHILAHIKRFPIGQFAAQIISGPLAGNCGGMATTMRTSRPPTAPILPWLEAIGDMSLSAHEPEGEWLYGVEMAVHRMYQGRGIGSGLYTARFDLVKQLNLRGLYLVGMLMGYRQQDCRNLTPAQQKELEKIRELNPLLVEPQRLRELNAALPTYADSMDAREYGEKVIAGEFKDPTVTMQMNRGFLAEGVVTNYADEPAAGDAGVLLVWENPDYEAD